MFADIFRDFLEESFDVKSHANQAIQGRAITEQLTKLAEGISLLDREIHSQVLISPKYFDTFTHFSLASFLWDIGKQYSPRCDAALCGVPSGAILFAQRNFIEN